MLAVNYKGELYESILRLLWRQWNELGVAGHGEGELSRRVLDPEALVVFSATFCRYEPRLYDLMADWMVRYSRLLNPTRLKSIINSARYKDMPSLSYLAALCVRAGDMRWKRAAECCRVAEEAELQSLFYAPDGAALYNQGADALARQYGFRRGEYVFRNKLRQQLGFAASTLLLNLRGVMGVTARAEVILLLMESPCSIQQLSDRSGFVRSAVKAVLDELVLVNMVCPIRKKGGKSVIYSLCNRGMCPLADAGGEVHFPRWNAVYDALGQLWQLASLPAMEKVSEVTFEGELRRVFRECVRADLLCCGVPELEAITEDSIVELPNILH